MNVHPKKRKKKLEFEFSKYSIFHGFQSSKTERVLFSITNIIINNFKIYLVQ